MKQCIFIFILLISRIGYADCLQAANGEVFCGAGSCDLSDAGIVFCSMYKDGGASINGQGRVECGKGQCLQGSNGSVFCSLIEDGGAATNRSGQVKCLDGCERGSESMCVSIRGL